MYILGIETSCDDTAAAVIEAKGGLHKPYFSVLSNVSYSQVAIHKKFGGIVPNLASRAHLQKIAPTVKAALSLSGLTSDVKKSPMSDIGVDLIAVTRGPGLMPSLLVGVNFARALAYKWKKPIIGVNHIEGHIYSNWLSSESRQSSLAFLARPCEARSGIRPRSSPAANPCPLGLITRSERIGGILFPALILIVSGGHTELVLMRGYGQYKIIGETLDDAAGECFDKTARILGLGFPGGPAISAAAEIAVSSSSYLVSSIRNRKIQDTKYKIQLPRPMINSNNYNFSFSGLKTAVLYAYKGKNRPEMAYEIQEAIVEVLVAKTLQAVKKFQPKTVMIAGGVAANKRLRECLTKKIAPYKIKVSLPELSYTTDNAAMIAAAAYFSYLKKSAGWRTKKDSWKKIEADANLRL